MFLDTDIYHRGKIVELICRQLVMILWKKIITSGTDLQVSRCFLVCESHMLCVSNVLMTVKHYGLVWDGLMPPAATSQFLSLIDAPCFSI